MGVAFEMTRVAPGIADRLDQVNETVAKTIMELARQGERNPDLLCERALLSRAIRYAGALKRDDFSSSRHPALAYCWSMIFSENRCPVFEIML
jgi:hypothetical protein